MDGGGAAMSRFVIDVTLRRDGFELRADFELPAGGVTVLLGPSGSGKTTLLRIVAGLERPQAGRILDGDAVWFDAAQRVCRPPQERRAGMVFQDYALFSHLSVAANVGYGVPRAQRVMQVDSWLRRLHLVEFAARYPRQLSGGQRQRVAVARALAPGPDVLLLDEPFAALDFTLRHYLREELQSAIEGLAIPVLMVTHDLDEARFLADRIGVMVDGRLVRVGAAAEVFADPGSYGAARALGWQNFLPLAEIEDRRMVGPWGAVELGQRPPVAARWLGIRPEHVKLGGVGIPACVRRISALGALRAVECTLSDGTRVLVHEAAAGATRLSKGEPVFLDLPAPYIRLF